MLKNKKPKNTFLKSFFQESNREKKFKKKFRGRYGKRVRLINRSITNKKQKYKKNLTPNNSNKFQYLFKFLL